MKYIPYWPDCRVWQKPWLSPSILLTAFVCNLGYSLPAIAQISVDGLTSTLVDSSNPGEILIRDGTLRRQESGGTALFHSFENFSPAMQNVYFDLTNGANAIDTTAIEVILNRVTGTSNSFIDGEMGVFQDPGTPSPDVFLINPNGIIFGTNAQLDLPGSFVASTADSILFENGLDFSAAIPDRIPLLTVSAPVGLQFGSTAAPIQVNDVALAVNPGQNLSFIGGDVMVTRSNLSAPGGRLQLVGLDAHSALDLEANGAIKLNNLDMIAASGFRNLLIEQSGLSVSGATNGYINLVGDDTTLNNSSVTANATPGGPAGSIDIKTAGTLTLNNNAALSSTALDVGNTGTISLTGDTINISAGYVLNGTSGAGDAGGVTIMAHEFVLDDGFINGDSSGPGNASHVTITANDVAIQDGGIVSDGLGDGRAGDITIAAANNFYLGPGGYTSNKTFGPGRAGDISFMADSILLEGVTFGNDAFASGDAGHITMIATDSLTITQSGFFNGTFSSGNAGNTTLTAGTLTIHQSNFGTSTANSGAAGDIHITADELRITQSGFGAGTFASGEAGHINIVAGDFLFEESGFGVSTNGTGRGGLITIDADNFTLRQAGFGSTVDTEAQNTIGGDINITVQDTMLMEQAGLGTDTLGQGDAGNLTVTAHNLIMVDSGLASDTLGPSDAGTLTVRADNIRMNNSRLTSSAQEDSIGNSGTVNVIARNLVLDESLIRTTVKNTDSNADSGQINVQADTIVLRELDNEGRRSSIESQNLGDGSSGDIGIAAREIVVEGGLISTAKFGRGEGSNLDIEVGELTITNGGSIFAANGTGATGSGNNVDLMAGRILLDQASSITVSTGGEGVGGLLQVTANTLDVLGGAQISSSSLEEIGFTVQQKFAFAGEEASNLDLVTPMLPDGTQYGHAGSIEINAHTINVQGADLEGNTSRITAFSQTNGDAGSIDIAANAVNVRDRGELTVSGTNDGSAGNLTIIAGALLLSNQASLRAETAAGDQGNIDLVTDRYVVLNRGSQITTNATNIATGGNIRIVTPILLGHANSDITANAVQGNGGNISITTQGLLGLEFRDRLTPGDDITASSDFGLGGSVNISPLAVNPDAGLTALPTDLVDSDNQIVAGCVADTAANFVATGRGGVPSDPSQTILEGAVLQAFETSPAGAGVDSDPLPALALPPVAAPPLAAPPLAAPPLVEATGWRHNSQGDVMLMAPVTTAAATACLGGA